MQADQIEKAAQKAFNGMSDRENVDSAVVSRTSDGIDNDDITVSAFGVDIGAIVGGALGAAICGSVADVLCGDDSASRAAIIGGNIGSAIGCGISNAIISNAIIRHTAIYMYTASRFFNGGENYTTSSVMYHACVGAVVGGLMCMNGHANTVDMAAAILGGGISGAVGSGIIHAGHAAREHNLAASIGTRVAGNIRMQCYC